MSKLNILDKHMQTDLKHLNKEGDFLVEYLRMNDTRSNSSSEEHKDGAPAEEQELNENGQAMGLDIQKVESISKKNTAGKADEQAEAEVLNSDDDTMSAQTKKKLKRKKSQKVANLLDLIELDKEERNLDFEHFEGTHVISKLNKEIFS